MKRIGSALINTSSKALAQSMTTKTMVVLAKKVFPNYDLYARTGFPSSMPIPNKEAARQIVHDMVKADRFLDFVLLLVEIGDKGLMGRRYTVPYMRDIISGVFELGYLYDTTNQLFVENPQYSITRNWGALKTAKEYTLTFLRIDIVGNSVIVRENQEEQVGAAYEALREICQNAVLKRNGRIWSWEGDGGLATFFFNNKNQSAVMAGREILHELFFYNKISCPLKSPLNIRVAIHSGPFDYTPDEEELKSCETIKRIMDIESRMTLPDSMTISSVVKLMLDAISSTDLEPFTGKDQLEYYRYTLKLEKP
ncbi:nucleotidyl cyclase domain-containing protein [Sediminispirochaeta smaragdinae]|uniref:Guanylate cyclase domain-containing protein n=1 Tax=Sediminispirochaeta smaragdinae (strain DSM 11293 / JCM 15392 / SEBR 4228) TaxID=573413 RepID=E1R818_SEDSS|nr:hypothetical protein [Sediminispirochaeta smaragdinae]ADK82873.1 hypothetical protein Spirs_3787 [Sediminispirochaeta smaragdinae DSM 11293]